MSQRARIWSFGLIWLGQLVSLFGTGISSFAFGVWIYQQTGSATLFALVALCNTLPNVLISPIAGALVDRWDRRWTMILSDGGAGLSTLALAVLLMTGQLETWHIYVGLLVSAVFGVFQFPAYSAAITLLVPKQHLDRANGMVQLIYAASQLVTPVLAGLLFVPLGLEGLLMLDAVTFVFAVGTLLLVRIPAPPQSAEGAEAKGSLGQEIAYGWRYILARPGLLGMLLFAASVNYSMGIVEVMIAPLVLGFASEKVLGTVLSVGGFGMLVGSLIMSVWGGPRRRIYGVVGFTLLQGLALVAGGLQASAVLIAGAAFVFLFSVPFILGSSQSIWQSKVPPDLQGRVFALRSMVSWSSLPLAYLSSGPLVDGVFGPLLMPGGALAGSLGRLIGVGPGRGAALLIILMGLCMISVAAIGYSHPRVRRVEDELEDIEVNLGAEPLAGAEAAST